MERKAVWCVVLFLLGLLLAGRMVGADEDCIEGEDGCQAPTVTQSTDAQNSIYILTDENFAQIVKEEELIMATFYAPWYVHKKKPLLPWVTNSPTLHDPGATIAIMPSLCLRMQ